jgi:hypothetical protein
MKQIQIVVLFFCFAGVAAMAQQRGVIVCLDRTSISVWEKPGGMTVIRQLGCGEEVSILGFERSYFKVDLEKGLYGYIDAKYVRTIESVSNEDKRKIVELQAEVDELKRQLSKQQQPATKQTKTTQYWDEPEEEPLRFDVAGLFRWSRAFSQDSLGMNLDYYGWNIVFGSNISQNFGLEASVGGFYWNAPSEFSDVAGITYYDFLGGPRFSFPAGSVTPFVHFLAGLTHAKISVIGLNLLSGNALSLMPGGGLDVNISRHFAIRPIQVDWRAIYDEGVWGTKDINLSGGLVVRF